jgi:hypothetical protein
LILSFSHAVPSHDQLPEKPGAETLIDPAGNTQPPRRPVDQALKKQLAEVNDRLTEKPVFQTAAVQGYVKDSPQLSKDVLENIFKANTEGEVLSVTTQEYLDSNATADYQEAEEKPVNLLEEKETFSIAQTYLEQRRLVHATREARVPVTEIPAVSQPEDESWLKKLESTKDVNSDSDDHVDYDTGDDEKLPIRNRSMSILSEVDGESSSESERYLSADDKPSERSRSTSMSSDWGLNSEELENVDDNDTKVWTSSGPLFRLFQNPGGVICHLNQTLSILSQSATQLRVKDENCRVAQLIIACLHALHDTNEDGRPVELITELCDLLYKDQARYQQDAHETLMMIAKYLELKHLEISSIETSECTICGATSSIESTGQLTIEIVTEVQGDVGLCELIRTSHKSMGGSFKCPTEDCVGHSGQETNRTSQTKIIQAPETLIVHINRNILGARSQTGIDVTRKVTLDEYSPFISQVLYDPVYILYHTSSGDVNDDDAPESVLGTDNGHFFGSLMHEENCKVFNDGRTYERSIEENDKRSRKTYMVLLKKRAQQTTSNENTELLTRAQGSEEKMANSTNILFTEIDTLELINFTKWSEHEQDISSKDYLLAHLAWKRLFNFLRHEDDRFNAMRQENEENNDWTCPVSAFFKAYEELSGLEEMVVMLSECWGVAIELYQLDDTGVAKLKYSGQPKEDDGVFVDRSMLDPWILICCNGMILPVIDEDGSKGLKAVFRGRPVLIIPSPAVLPKNAPNYDMRHTTHKLIIAMCLLARTKGRDDLFDFHKMYFGDETPKKDLPKTMQGRQNTFKKAYWMLRQSGALTEASLLYRIAESNTSIEGGVAMLVKLVRIRDMFYPWNEKDTHIIIGCGRRATQLLEVVIDNNVVVVGVEHSSLPVEESRRLIQQTRLKIPLYKPRIHVQLMDGRKLVRLDGFTSASRFDGPASASGDPDRRMLDEMIFNTLSLVTYWSNHTTVKYFASLTLTMEARNSWKCLVVKGMRQEHNNFNTYMWVRLVTVAHKPLIPSKLVKALIASA